MTTLTESPWVQAKAICDLVYDLSPYADFAEASDLINDLKGRARELGYPIFGLPPSHMRPQGRARTQEPARPGQRRQRR